MRYIGAAVAVPDLSETFGAGLVCVEEVSLSAVAGVCRNVHVEVLSIVAQSACPVVQTEIAAHKHGFTGHTHN